MILYSFNRGMADFFLTYMRGVLTMILPPTKGKKHNLLSIPWWKRCIRMMFGGKLPS